MNFHLKYPFCRDLLIFHLQIKSKFLGVLRNSGRDGYENFYTVKIGGNPHTIKLFRLEAQGRIPTHNEMIVYFDNGDRNRTYISD
jgi:hypothetical protein